MSNWLKSRHVQIKKVQGEKKKKQGKGKHPLGEGSTGRRSKRPETAVRADEGKTKFIHYTPEVK